MMSLDTNRADHLEDRGGNLRFLQALLEESQIGRGSRVLEIGCGTGIFASYLATCSGAVVIGTEISLELVRAASLRIPCLHLPGGGVPDTEGPFDLVFCKDVIPMISNKLSFFASIRHRLRRGGKFITYVPSPNDFQEKFLYRFIPGSLRESRSHYGALRDILGMLRESGFTEIRTRRLFLGTVAVNRRYVSKHGDGFFSNTEAEELEEGRLAGLERLQRGIQLLENEGMLLHYEWERTLVVSR
jgi:SAM-dependent methyltransferase